MPLDPSIFNALGRGKTAFEWQQDYEDRDNKRAEVDLRRQSLGMEQQRNALALDSARRQASDDAALRSYMAGTPDIGTPEAQAGLYRVAPGAAGGVIKTYNEGLKAKREATAAETAQKLNEQKLADAKWEARMKTHQQAILDISGMTNADEALANLQKHVQAGDIDFAKASMIANTLQQTRGNDAAFKQWRAQMVNSLMDAKDRAMAERQAHNDAATNANRKLIPDGKGGWVVNEPLVQADERIGRASAPVTMGAPVQGIDPKTGQPVFFQPGNRPGVGPQIVPGIQPPPKASELKPLPGAVIKDLTEARDHAATIEGLSSSFKDEYAGKGVFGFGADASLAAKGVTGSDQGSVQWWKDYRKQSELTERNKMFGASLTDGEKAAWANADISPGMSAVTIKNNLATRKKLAQKVLDFTRQDMIDAGHDEGRVNAIAGRKAPTAAAKNSGPAVGTVEGGYRFKGGDPSNQANWEKVK